MEKAGEEAQPFPEELIRLIAEFAAGPIFVLEGGQLTILQEQYGYW
jgi:hypothetical protein